MTARGTVLLLSAALFAPGCDLPEAREDPPPRISLQDAMAPASAQGFSRAAAPRTFAFPADHGPHPAFQTEWWYFVGNLATPEGRPFGYQLTFFRSALEPPGEARQGGSRWRARNLYMAHLALTDPRSRRFHSFERFSRDGLGLAGAKNAPFRIWLEDWSASLGREGEGGFRLEAREGEAALALELRALKPPVLQGDEGLSRKGLQPGNASYYYSLTRLSSRGSLELDGVELAVEGTSWLDREWSTGALEPDQTGWDWLALQLSDGRELMVYRLRRADGSAHPTSSGTWVEPTGEATPLPWEELSFAPRRWWRSPDSGASYPVAWRLESPSRSLTLRVEPLLDRQEHLGSVLYWEGAVTAEGKLGGESVTGRGYLELTGYAPEQPDD